MKMMAVEMTSGACGIQAPPALLEAVPRLAPRRREVELQLWFWLRPLFCFKAWREMSVGTSAGLDADGQPANCSR